MASVTLQLSAETEDKLRQKAHQQGLTLEAYLERMAHLDAGAQSEGASLGVSSSLSEEEFNHLLDELSEGPPLRPLPTDFSRSDIYADHD